MTDTAPAASPNRWLAQRTAELDSSGIRNVFDLARELKDPVNLSIGQVDYPAARSRQAVSDRIDRAERNRLHADPGYRTASQRLQQEIDHQFPGQ